MPPTGDEKEGKSILQVRILLKFEEKFWKFINTVDSRYLEYSKNRTSYKLLLKTFQKSYWSLPSKTYRNSHLITRSIYVFYPNNHLIPLRILSYRESTVGAFISSLTIYKILFPFSWLAIHILF